jgi:hypothetical protein
METSASFEARSAPSSYPTCSLTSCCHWSGASPDDGEFPVHPSSLVPSAMRRRRAPKAGTTTSSEGRVGPTPPGRSQSGGLGKRTGRSMTRTMQRRNRSPSSIAGRDGESWVATPSGEVEACYRGPIVMGQDPRTHRRKVDGTCGKGSSESREGLVGRRGVPAQRRRGV